MARLIDRRHRAALHGDGDRARHRLLQRLVGDGGEFRCAAGDAHAGRADHRDAGALDRFAQLCAAFAALRVAAFAEAGGIDGGAARAGAAAVLQNLDGGFGRREDREMVGRLRQRVELRIAGRAPDIVAVRIDRKDLPGKSEPLEIVVDALRPVAGAVRCADQNDVVRVEQMPDRVVPAGDVMRARLAGRPFAQTFSTLRNGPRPGRYDFSSRNCFMPCCSRISLSFFVSESCFDLR